MTIKGQLSSATIQWLQNHDYSPEALNDQRENGDTALIKATKTGAIEVVQELLANGANLNLRNNDGNNALWFACFGNYFLLIELLINAGIDINNQNDNGATVLMYTASAGKTEIVKLLLKAGANLNLKNLDDFKAIDFASTIEVLRVLQNAKTN